MSAGALMYWCHECQDNVRPRRRGNLVCPSCRGTFLEEIESHRVAQINRRNTPTEGGGGLNSPRSFSDSNQRQSRRHGIDSEFSPLFDALEALVEEMHHPRLPRGSRRRDFDSSDLQVSLQRQIEDLFEDRDGLEVFLESGLSRRHHDNFGDYFFGPNFDQLIQHFVENDPNRYGSLPASQSAINRMPTIRIGREHHSSDSTECAICKEHFDLGCLVREMPCKHLYHGECILPWLALHNSCPVCRYEMPSDDSRATSSAPSRSRSSSRGTSTADTSSNGVRRSGFPWPFRL